MIVSSLMFDCSIDDDSGRKFDYGGIEVKQDVSGRAANWTDDDSGRSFLGLPRPDPSAYPVSGFVTINAFYFFIVF